MRLRGAARRRAMMVAYVFTPRHDARSAQRCALQMLLRVQNTARRCRAKMRADALLLLEAMRHERRVAAQCV